MCVLDADDRSLVDTSNWYATAMALQSELTRVRHVIREYLADPNAAGAGNTLAREAAPAPRLAA